jgi:hypothetical protein
MPPNTRAVTRWTKFGNPFTVLNPIRGAGRSWRVVWSYCRAGRGRRPPAGFEPTRHRTRHQANEQAVRCFREWLTAPEQTDLLDQARLELAGLNLRCSCSLDLPCHADVLLDLVN